MKIGRADRIRIWMANWLFTTFYGMTLGQWLGLLRRHGYGIHPHYWPRAGFITLTSAATSIGKRYEDWAYGSKFRDLEIMPPLFILGHWRSGTTHLHNLIAADERFAYPNLYQVTNPQTFLSSERVFSVFGPLSPKTRLVDSMRFGFVTPQEEEFAIANAVLLSPYLGWAFPRDQEYYEKYLTLRDVAEEEVEQWKAALVLFLKKLTWKYKRPLVLKSPAHTCRIRLLLELFPDARFVHIHRDPYTVFQSTRRLYELMYRATRLQPSTMRGINKLIIRCYKTMYGVFFDERDLIPDRQLHELSFCELVRSPMDEMRNIYEALDLPGFAEAQPAFQRYLDSTTGYRPCEYPELPSGLRREIARAWQPSFLQWEYAT